MGYANPEDSKVDPIVLNEFPNVGKPCVVEHTKPLGWSQTKRIRFKLKRTLPKLLETTVTSWCLGRFDWWHKGKEVSTVIAERVEAKDGELDMKCAPQSNIGEGNKKATAVYLKTVVTLEGLDDTGKKFMLAHYTCHYSIVVPAKFIATHAPAAPPAPHKS